jgi:anti-anti-sigma regulatory factor
MPEKKQEITINIKGTLTGPESIKKLTKQLDELIEMDARIVNLNLEETDSIESAAITQILVYKKKFSEKNTLLRIKGCSDRMMKILKMLKLDNSISIIQ